MISTIARWTGFLAILFVPLLLNGQNIPGPLSGDKAFVYDEAGMLSQVEHDLLIKKLKAYNDSTSNEFALVIESTLNESDAFERSLEIAEKWGLGKEKKDNGLLIYIAVREMEIFIQVGEGLEGRITDGRTGDVIRKVMVPYFKKGEYYEGINQGIDKLVAYAAGEFEGEDEVVSPPVWVIILIIGFIVLLIIIFGRGGTTYTGKRHSHHGPWGWGGGFGGFGGGGLGGGGGFGGFGGGSFGGGGAGGSWR